MTKVFAYGTLKRGGRWHRVFMRSAQFMGETTIPNFRVYQQGRRPIAVAAPGASVQGEVYVVPTLVHLGIAFLERMAKYRAIRVPTVFGTATMYVYK